MNNLSLLLIGFLFLGTSLSCSRQIPKRTYKLPDQLNEVSGLYLEHPHNFWWQNDGGHAPELYQTDGTGKITEIIALPRFKNQDWEDLTHDDKGNIYIGDFGNNTNRRKNLRIYIYDPDTQQMDSILYKYPDQTSFPPASGQANFDMEAFFWYQDALHLFSKNELSKGDYYTKHYTLPDTSSTDQVAILEDQLFLKNRVVTAAAISPDHQTIALLAYDYKKIFGVIPYAAASVFLIKNFEGTAFFEGEIYKKRAPYFLFPTQFEALDFLDNETIYVAAEKTLFLAPKAKRIKLKNKDFKKHKRID